MFIELNFADLHDADPANGVPAGALNARKKVLKATGANSLPFVAIDSGHKYSYGYKGGTWTSYYNAFKPLCDQELARSPQTSGTISATSWRVGNQLKYEVTVTNGTGVTLDSAVNEARVSVLVYQDVPPESVALTTRYAKSAVSVDITTPLANAATATYQLSTPDLTNVGWANLHSVVFVEYRPYGHIGTFDSLQAVVPVAPTFDTQQDDLVFIVDSFNPRDLTGQVNFTGSPSSTVWTASADRSWITLEPSTGTASTPSTVHIASSTFERGDYSGTITYTGTIGGYTIDRHVPVEVHMTDVFEFFMPSILR